MSPAHEAGPRPTAPSSTTRGPTAALTAREPAAPEPAVADAEGPTVIVTRSPAYRGRRSVTSAQPSSSQRVPSTSTTTSATQP